MLIPKLPTPRGSLEEECLFSRYVDLFMFSTVLCLQVLVFLIVVRRFPSLVLIHCIGVNVIECVCPRADIGLKWSSASYYCISLCVICYCPLW